MWTIKRILQWLFTCFGFATALLFLYFVTVENPAEDWFVFAMTFSLAGICAEWICDNNKDGKGDA